jgi:hypothetical protein
MITHTPTRVHACKNIKAQCVRQGFFCCVYVFIAYYLGLNYSLLLIHLLSCFPKARTITGVGQESQGKDNEMLCYFVYTLLDLFQSFDGRVLLNLFWERILYDGVNWK